MWNQKWNQSDTRIYFWTKAHVNKFNQCVLNRKKIAVDCKLSRTSVYRSIQALQERKIINIRVTKKKIEIIQLKKNL